jgi:hypothetical protein
MIENGEKEMNTARMQIKLTWETEERTKNSMGTNRIIL